MKHFFFVLVMFSSFAWAQSDGEKTMRICDENGCSDQPRHLATFNPAPDTEADQRRAALEDIATKDPLAAFDLGLRYFRGDGVRQDSYLALKWMRNAAERGYTKAQTAVGRYYLMGMEEMGSSPAEAEKWLAIAAENGDQEAKKLLIQASAAKEDEVAYQRWVGEQRASWYGYWYQNYSYHWQWRSNAWYGRNY